MKKKDFEVKYLNDSAKIETSFVYDIKYENVGFERKILFLLFSKSKGFTFVDAAKCEAVLDIEEKKPEKEPEKDVSKNKKKPH
ncbi:hypothetical protein GQ473_06080 [archaeon]|nr:hypothetical protein [archaeon]